MKKTWAVSRNLTRVSFALVCGLMFHCAYFVYDIRVFNITTFAVASVLFYMLLDWYEDVTFTRPINVSSYPTDFLSVEAQKFRTVPAQASWSCDSAQLSSASAQAPLAQAKGL